MSIERCSSPPSCKSGLLCNRVPVVPLRPLRAGGDSIRCETRQSFVAFDQTNVCSLSLQITFVGTDAAPELLTAISARLLERPHDAPAWSSVWTSSLNCRNRKKRKVRLQLMALNISCTCKRHHGPILSFSVKALRPCLCVVVLQVTKCLSILGRGRDRQNDANTPER